MAASIGGFVEPGYEGVREAFASNFEEHGEVGAAFCLHVSGRKVVDVWGGSQDRDGTVPYDADTLQLVFSTTKGVTAAAANLLAQRGQLDVDAPVAEYWPEFAQAGKADIPVRWLLNHKAGLPVIDQTLTLEQALDWDTVVDALARQAPVWEPGTAHGYHALTYGWLVGELVRRIGGKSLGAFVADELATPLGLELWIGLPAEQEQRVAPLLGGLVDPEAANDPAARAMIEQFMGPDTLLGRALTLGTAFAAPGAFNDPRVHAAQLGAANCITNATSLSRLYAGLIGPVDGVSSEGILKPDQIDAARETQTDGADRCLVFPTTFGLGFMTSGTFAPFGGVGAFGHPGAGGSVGFADPDNGIAFGYVMNRMMQNLSGDPRTRGLVRAAYDAAGAPAVNV